MTREEYTAEQIAASGWERHRWLETFRVYPCWCQQPECPGWRNYTEREIQVVLACQDHLLLLTNP